MALLEHKCYWVRKQTGNLRSQPPLQQHSTHAHSQMKERDKLKAAEENKTKESAKWTPPPVTLPKPQPKPKPKPIANAKPKPSKYLPPPQQHSHTHTHTLTRNLLAAAGRKQMPLKAMWRSPQVDTDISMGMAMAITRMLLGPVGRSRQRREGSREPSRRKSKL